MTRSAARQRCARRSERPLAYAWSSCLERTTAIRVAKAATFTAADLRDVLLSEVVDFVGRE